VSAVSSLWFRALAALVAIALLSALGFWQLDRARQKRELHALFTERLARPPLDLLLHQAVPLADEAWRATRAYGSYGSPTFLLDNRIREGRVGYEVLSTFTLPDGQHILVDLGWLPAGATRHDLPRLDIPAHSQPLRGRLAPAPSTGIALGPPMPPEQVGPGLWRVQRVEFDALGDRFGIDYLPALVYLDAGEPGGYDRNWALPAPDDGKHTAYAVQWFSMAGAIVIIFLLSLRRRANAGRVPE
jgi:surfeit locus 1 family protein